jgi:uncharacterized membrane protein YgaE (UPF0421/DUF939 family)
MLLCIAGARGNVETHNHEGNIMGFVAFMASTFGRWARIVVGLVLAFVALTLVPVAGVIVMSVGLLLIALGASDTCLFAPLVGRSFNGSDSRR